MSHSSNLRPNNRRLDHPTTGTLVLIMALALVFYSLPWVVTASASLNLGAYDLAEWASLHPAVRASTPPLLVTFVLRLPLVCIAVIGAFGTPITRRWLALLIVGGISVALLPPELLPTTGNPNSQQQFALALTALVVGAVGVSGIGGRGRGGLAALGALIGAAASLIGLALGTDLMRGFDLPTAVGGGGVALAGLFGLIGVRFARGALRRSSVVDQTG
ncbi:MAG: hypothetical protein GYB67_03515 [Chloroflexi bacterium]|nr:hypothetical protein [Chloroflexota bacterium]